jgi:hypothetical protein
MSNRETLGDAPIEPDFVEGMNQLGGFIDQFFNGDLRGKDRKVGFCLMVFGFDDGTGRANYISNADRADVVTLLKEQLARFEGQPEMKGTA